MQIIPMYQHDLLDKCTTGSFSLVFARTTSWRKDRDQLKAEFQSGTRRTRNGPIPVFDPSIVQLGHRGNELLSKVSQTLDDVHLRQQKILDWSKRQGQFIFETRARLTSPFVSGLGSGHPTETGMILDRNTGMPYIPASAIKGASRLAHSINLLRSGQAQQWVRTGIVDSKGRFRTDPSGDQLELDDREPSLRKYFGDTNIGSEDGVRGQLIFLDVFPEAPPILKTDIINPHFHRYYCGDLPPVDIEDPIPVKFLSVEKGTVFVFRVLAAPLALPRYSEGQPVQREFGPDDEHNILAMFQTVFEELGLGGKTSVGYGRFQIMDRLQVQDSSGTLRETTSLKTDNLPDPQTDVQAERRNTLGVFKSALPRQDALPGQVDNLLQSIRAKDDEQLRKLCCQALLDHARTNKKFNKLRKANKQWTTKLMKLCAELGVE